MHREQAERDLANLRTRFSEWRKRRKRIEPVPENLWIEVAVLSKFLPLTVIQKELRLDYTSLRKQISRRSKTASLTEFVELKHPTIPVTKRYPVVEIESPDGFTIRIFSMDASPLIQEFMRR